MKKKMLVSSAAAAMLLGMFSPYTPLAANPYLPLWEHIPDGEPRVFEDPDNPGKYRIYIIGSHDTNFTEYCGLDVRAWSAPVEDLNDWRDEGPIFSFKDPILNTWDTFYAPDLVEVLRRDENGERTIREYYLYPHSRGPGREAMVAKSSRPDGGFEPVNLKDDGRTLLQGSIMGFDPSVYIEYIDDPDDPDFDVGFRAYGYWGFQRSFAAELDQNTMYSVRPGTEVIRYFIPASNSYGDVRDPEGTEYPHVFSGEDLGAFNFFEAASIRKVGNKYVWVYSGYSGPDYGLGSSNATLRYAYGDSPLGPWRSGGVLIDARAVVPNDDGTALRTSYSGHNTHGSIEQIGDQWYVFYHRAPRGFGYARQAMVAPVHVSYDLASVADGGGVTITGWDVGDVPKTVRAGAHEYTGAEVTSEGFNIFGLDPFRYYSAGIACYLSGTGIQADAWDIWEDHAPLTNVASGHIIGYKYFGFDGLAESSKGIAAFDGKGTNMRFNVFLLPLTQREFKINVWLDGAWDNDVRNGTKIGEILVPGRLDFEVARFDVDISGYEDMLTGKRAIFLELESAAGGTLCNLIGLGFSADGKDISYPAPPQIGITADDVPLKLPNEPVRSDSLNGITDYCLYQLDYELPEGALRLPHLIASSDYTGMNIAVTYSQPNDETCVASVDFDLHGSVKTYNIVFSPLSNLADPAIPPYVEIPPSEEPGEPESSEQANPTSAPEPEQSPPPADDRGSRLPWGWLLPLAGAVAGVAVVGAVLRRVFRKR